MKTLLTLTAFSLRLAFRNRQEILGLLIVYLIIGSLFPLALGPEREMLRVIGVAVIWVAAFLSAALSLPRVFEEDYRDGTLEQLLLLPALPHFVVMAKMAAHWLITGVPLIFISPLLGLMYGLLWEEIGIMLIPLMAGTVLLSAIIILTATLTAGLGKGGGMTGILLVLPLCLPVLIYGSGVTQLAIQRNMESQFFTGAVGLAVIMLITLPVAVWFSTLAMKFSVTDT